MEYKAIKSVSKKKYFFIKNYKKVVNDNVNYAIKSENIMKDIKHKHLINMVSSFEYKNNTIFLYYNYNCSDLITIYENNDESYLNIIESIKYDISQQLINVVKFLHENNICHRDIKLDNILLNNNNILVCDYEYCINTDDIGCNDDIMNRYVGTELYMAPEIINREVNLNYKSVDIWNTALVIFVILTKGQLLMYDTFKYWRHYYNKDIIQKFFIYNENTYDFTNFFMLSLNPKNTKRQLLNIL
jgi:serine/threonine protein kinase